MGKKLEIDERRCVAVTPLGVPRGCRCIPCDDDFKTLFEQIPQVRFHAHVRQHPAENDFANAALAELQDEVVGLRTKHPMGTDNNSLAVIDEGLEPLEPVGARPGEAFEAQSSAASKHLGLSLIGLEGAVEFPSTVAGKEVMWRNENFVSVLFRRLEDALHILDGLVLRDASADERPGEPFVTQHLILRVDKYHGGVILIYVHGYLLFLGGRGGEDVSPCCTAQPQATKRRFVSYGVGSFPIHGRRKSVRRSSFEGRSVD